MKSVQGINHIAFIMDGNRRWAVEHGLPKMKGHTEGVENFKKIVEYCSDLNIPYITFWALSTDNLKKRGAAELQHLFKLLGDIKKYLDDFKKHDAQIRYIGDLSKLPKWLQVMLREVEKKTKDHRRIIVTLAINYGGKNELVRMARELVKDAPKTVTEKTIENHLDSGWLPPVDLLVRTGGHMRLSTYLPWQIGYAEMYFTEKKWPAFNKADLKRAIEWYFKQERNFGK